jgi:hypothetical protein
MEDSLITQQPTQAATTPQGAPQDPDYALLGHLSITAMQRTLEGARWAIAAGLERKLTAEDHPQLKRAAMAAWEVCLLAIVTDSFRPEALRGRAAQMYLVARPVIEEQAGLLATALIEAVQ